MLTGETPITAEVIPMLDLSPMQMILLAICVPPLLVIAAALGWHNPEQKPPSRRPLDSYNDRQ